MSTTAKPKKVTAKTARDFVAGMDVGGTKTEIADSHGAGVHRYKTSEYQDIYAVLDEYFAQVGARPARVAVAMAGPRDPESGAVTPTNFSWPRFDPAEAARRYPGTEFDTFSDMIAMMAGVVHGSNMDVKQLKAGKPTPKAAKVIVTISTGVNTCMAAWDRRGGHYVYVPAESGHIGFQPFNEAEERHLKHIFGKYRYPSIELAISGSHGVGGWIEHSPELNNSMELADALKRAEKVGSPAGAVLLAFATEGTGPGREAARAILHNMGTLVGNVLADYGLAYLATGGLYLTGSVSVGLAEYWAEHTDFVKAFVRSGTDDHAPWLEPTLKAMPIYLVTNPRVAVNGALALAQEGF